MATHLIIVLMLHSFNLRRSMVNFCWMFNIELSWTLYCSTLPRAAEPMEWGCIKRVYWIGLHDVVWMVQQHVPSEWRTGYLLNPGGWMIPQFQPAAKGVKDSWSSLHISSQKKMGFSIRKGCSSSSNNNNRGNWGTQASRQEAKSPLGPPLHMAAMVVWKRMGFICFNAYGLLLFCSLRKCVTGSGLRSFSVSPCLWFIS